MGGAPKPKRESNAARSARMAAEKRSGVDARAIRVDDAMLKRSKKRTSLFGGAETGIVSLGGSAGKLGMY